MDFTILTTYQDQYLEGFLTTLESSLYALLGAFLLGVIVAVLRIAPSRWLNGIGAVYVEFIRNVPLLVHVAFFYAGFPVIGIDLDGFTAGTIGLALYTSAYIAEALRAGIQAVPKGQTEAARSSGLTYLQTMRFIVLPQAFKVVIPPLGNQCINLVKNSAVLATVAAGDLMYHGDLINSETFDTFSTYIFVALFYLVLTIPLSQLVGFFERRLARAH